MRRSDPASRFALTAVRLVAPPLALLAACGSSNMQAQADRSERTANAPGTEQRQQDPRPRAVQRFEDPAPPTTPSSEPIEPPAARAFEGLVRAASPRPLAADARAEDWPTFLGPQRDGLCRERPLALPANDGDALRLVWSIPRGEGYASPVVRDGRLVFVHRVGDEHRLDCHDARTGERFWSFAWPCTFRARYGGGDGPRSSPTIDAEGRVYVQGVHGKLHCLELATGRLLWQRDLQTEFGLVEGFFGVSSSPLALGDDLLLVNLGAPGGPCAAAFDRATGRLVWGSGDRWGASCASPTFGRTADGREFAFVLAGGRSRPPTGGLLVVDPLDGALLHREPFRSRMEYSVTASSPLAGPDLDWVFLSAGYGVGSRMVGDPTGVEPRTLWSTDRVALDFGNPVFVAGTLFALENRGRGSTVLLGFDPLSGTVRSELELDWEEPLVLRPGEEPRVVQRTVGRGSLLGLVGNDVPELLCLGEQGHLLRIRVDREGLALVARTAPFLAGESWTPPVIAHGLLYLCQNTPEPYGERRGRRLLCFDLRG
jgi:outer membrane protein assembly factor BamB